MKSPCSHSTVVRPFCEIGQMGGKMEGTMAQLCPWCYGSCIALMCWYLTLFTSTQNFSILVREEFFVNVDKTNATLQLFFKKPTIYKK